MAYYFKIKIIFHFLFAVMDHKPLLHKMGAFYLQLRSLMAASLNKFVLNK